jgi:hypothetical protein
VATYGDSGVTRYLAFLASADGARLLDDEPCGANGLATAVTGLLRQRLHVFRGEAEFFQDQIDTRSAFFSVVAFEYHAGRLPCWIRGGTHPARIMTAHLGEHKCQEYCGI